MKQMWVITILVAVVLFPVRRLVAQEIVHALCGTVSSVDATGKTITLFQDNGSRATFKLVIPSNTRVDFDKKIADETTPAQEFHKQGAYVILFYFGTDENRTAVALKSLGAGPFSSTSGQVSSNKERDHSISVSDSKGGIHSFKIDSQTVAETYMGVAKGSKADFGKGDRVRIVSAVKEGSPTALFIREN